ncbi:hypothetical protein MEM_02030 [Candida albicans L26]|uniref:Fgr12p n=3 Tax=Candida albicans TaxID=5476 RepID=Q59P58_CANAL|nr:Fgr12p [Candida albicans SC5314]KAF6063572.1 hypothetical protein FOB64_005206 [Candida albicans]KGQ96480.1 hypothetical protein MEU_02018 [Candida albicans P37005]KGR13606.1 hypothetical protein MG3_02035 [Candida albicans P78048]KGR20966.1 hypothetical protein MG9_02034 [Candida albicans P37037]KGT70803.1 hypothetical protein MEK_02048 [Candida albicans 12C]KGU14300.1 hypothetical protein MEY_02028 [Candida albicans 19F]KGU15410.1 hypothetical protein MEM_02030 [Candida albicans L26]KG|eukprot:XP_711471.1 Fgr12p [Candida albicans SC5314]
MVLNFDEELNLQEYTISNQGSKRTRSVKPDNISNILEEAPNEIPNNQSNVDFTNSELEYLTCHSLTAHAFENSEIDVSPAISNQTHQSLRPSFSSEYDTDTTDLIGFVEQNTHHAVTTSNRYNKSSEELVFQESIDYSTFLENVLERENNNSIGNIESSREFDNAAANLFSSENCEHDLLLLQHELQETGIPIEQFQPQSYIYNEENDDFLNQSPAQVNTAATITTTTTSSVSVLSLVKSPCHVTSNYEDFVTSPIYEWPNDESGVSVDLLNTINVRVASLEPKTVSDAVRKTIREEFVIQDMFLNGQSPLPPEIPRSIRKKSDRDVEWTPLSVYKAYTNIKSPTNGKEAYNHLVPYTSCIGTLNYRPKDHAAWKRAPNRRR